MEPQRLRLADYAAQRGWEIVAERSDVASGGNDQRPGLKEAEALIHSGGAEALLVVRLDRAARSVSHLAKLAERVAIVASDQPFDTTTAAGRMMFGMLSVIAAFERDLLRERTLDGLNAARARGSRLGRPKLAPAVIERARFFRASGASWRATAEGCSASVSALRRALA